jgi:uncharacterized transporter YbjL
VFSVADYELASRVLGLPVPTTPAEMAAATPLTARVLRQFGRVQPPVPGQEAEGIYTGATRSLNAMPDTTQPREKAQLASRLRTEVEDPYADAYLVELLTLLEDNPELVELMLQVLDQLDAQSDQHMDALSSQRPAEYDTPNLGANYSMLNAPSSNHISPSQAFQPLG